MDSIKEVHPNSSGGHRQILIATDYFTKWVKIEADKKISQRTVTRFIERKIIHQYGLLEFITMDQALALTGKMMVDFAEEKEKKEERIYKWKRKKKKRVSSRTSQTWDKQEGQTSSQAGKDTRSLPVDEDPIYS